VNGTQCESISGCIVLRMTCAVPSFPNTCPWSVPPSNVFSDHRVVGDLMSLVLDEGAISCRPLQVGEKRRNQGAVDARTCSPYLKAACSLAPSLHGPPSASPNCARVHLLLMGGSVSHACPVPKRWRA